MKLLRPDFREQQSYETMGTSVGRNPTKGMPLVGFWSGAELVSRLDLNHPRTTVGGIPNRQ